MIRIHDKSDFNYLKNNGLAVLDPRSCVISRELNGAYKLEIIHPLDESGKWKYIEEQNIIVAPTPKGLQGFRISVIKKSNNNIFALAKHVFFDLSHNLIMDLRVTGEDGYKAGSYILKSAIDSHNFKFYSNIKLRNTACYTRSDIVSALIGNSDSSFINRWGGEIELDNYDITINNKVGNNYGVEARYGKNLTSFQEEISMDNIITRIIPISGDGTTLEGGLEWVDSPIIDRYSIVYSKEVKMDWIKVSEDGEGYKTKEECQSAMINECRRMFQEDKIDRPKVVYDITFIDLARTDEYKEYSVLENIGLGDTVKVLHTKFNIDIETRMIAYEYDCINKKYLTTTLSNQSTIETYSKTQNALAGIIAGSGVKADMIQGYLDLTKTNMGIMVEEARQHRGTAILFENIVNGSKTYGATAIGTKGLLIANKRTANGREWDWRTALTGEGIVADQITVGTLRSIMIENMDGSFQIDLSQKGGARYFNNGKLAMEMKSNLLKFYSWFENGDFIGDLGAYRNPETGAPIIALSNDEDSVLMLGYKYDTSNKNSIKSYITLDKYNTLANSINKAPIKINEEFSAINGWINGNGDVKLSVTDEGLDLFYKNKLIFSVSNNNGINALNSINIPVTTKVSATGITEGSKPNINGKIYDVNTGKIIYDSNDSSIGQVGQEIVNQARRLIGIPYKQDGSYNYLTNNIPPYIDCSSLCQWSYYQKGKKISRTTYSQINEGKEVSLSDLQLGDLVFTNFSGNNIPEHVYLYSGYKDGAHWCVEAPYPGQFVRERVFTIGESGSMRARRLI